jgi:sodium-dependent dicarboxylate transporter 2/3/5
VEAVSETVRHSTEQRWHPRQPRRRSSSHDTRSAPSPTDFDRPRAPARRRRVGQLVGVSLLVAALLAPLPLTTAQQRLTAVLLFAIVYWVTEALPIPVTSIVVLALCAVLNVPRVPRESTDSNPAEEVFTLFSSPTMFLLIGGFIMAQAMIKHDLGRRIALSVLALPGVAGSTYSIIIAFGALAALLSSVVDNGAVVTILLPLAIGTYVAIDELVDEQAGVDVSLTRFGAALMLMTAYSATVGGLLTPIGDSSNLVGQRLISNMMGVSISFSEWILLAVPIVAILFPLLCVVILILNRPEVGRIPGGRAYFQQQRAELGGLSRAEVNTLLAFGVAAFAWMLPSALALIAGEGSGLHLYWRNRLHPSVGALLGATLLFLLPTGRGKDSATLTWKDAMRIDWGTLLVVGTGLTLGALTFTTGLADVLGNGLADRMGHGTPALLIQLTIAGAAILVSEMASNTASVGVMLPIIPAFAVSAGVDPLTVAIVTVFAATYGFMLPISTSANAIAYSSGAIPMPTMVRTGIVIDLSGLLIIVGAVNLILPLVGVT